MLVAASARRDRDTRMRAGSNRRSRAVDALVGHLGVALRLRRERSQLSGHSALKKTPNSCKDASHDPGYTVHDISLCTPRNPRNVRVVASVASVASPVR